MSTLRTVSDKLSAGVHALQLQRIQREFGITEFRPLQRESIQAALQRRDSLTVMPTGGGKSLCYQGRAILEPPSSLRGSVAPSLTVVVSPLIALMKDQVDALTARGIPAARLDPSMRVDEQIAVEKMCRAGTIRLLYLSPERLFHPATLTMLLVSGVARFVIDEAHCISQWGHDFRPAYRKLGDVKKAFSTEGRSVPIHAFTATANEVVREDICALLGLADPVVLVGDFDRPNLIINIKTRHDLYHVHRCVGTLRHSASSAVRGIIYCITRRHCESLVSELAYVKSPPRIAAYHAGLPDEERERVQNAFSSGELDIIVATIAFGMGINVPDVRFVIHAGLPSSLEQYHQQIGRAGRDDRSSDCILLWSPDDVDTWLDILDNDGEPVHNRDERVAALGWMAKFVREKQCRHAALCAYFGQPYETPNCGACDVCLNHGATKAERMDVIR